MDAFLAEDMDVIYKYHEAAVAAVGGQLCLGGQAASRRQRALGRQAWGEVTSARWGHHRQGVPRAVLMLGQQQLETWPGNGSTGRAGPQHQPQH